MSKKPVINVNEIPGDAWEVGCRVLNDAIRRAMSDPDKRAAYEAWKKRRAKGKHG